jgi:predicted DNA-binding antitoxin AbrB/MazE fold protein
MDQLPIDAVFENGLFRPLDPVPVSVQEGERVRLHIEESSRTTSLDLACQVYDGLSLAEIVEIERIALERDSFFGTRATN